MLTNSKIALSLALRPYLSKDLEPPGARCYGDARRERLMAQERPPITGKADSREGEFLQRRDPLAPSADRHGRARAKAKRDAEAVVWDREYPV